MTDKEAIDQLGSLMYHCENMKNGEPDDVWADDVEALNLAIKALEERPRSEVEDE